MVKYDALSIRISPPFIPLNENKSGESYFIIPEQP